MTENNGNWDDLYAEFEGGDISHDQNGSWKEIFGDDLPDELMEELGLDVPLNGDVHAEDAALGETFPIDATYFDEAEDDPFGDTNVIPREVQDISAYTDGELPIILEDPDYGDLDDEDEDEEEDDPRKYRAIRRVRRRRTGLLGGFMYAAFILGLATVLAFVGWMVVDDVLGLTVEEFVAEVTIPENFTIEDVANELHAQGLIQNRRIFQFFAGMFNYYDRIQPGVYQVRPADYRALIGRLNQRTGALIAVRVTLPEGLTMRQIFQRLEDAGVSTVELLTYAAENGEFAFDFLDEVPVGTMNRLEGFLFPDTYDFFLQQNPEAVIRRLLRGFDERMQMNDVYELVEESPFTLREILNIASMIERETASVEEMPRISSVIWNRLDTGMHLGIDATIQYLLDEPMEFLTTTVINAHRDSPYNTYHIIGLPYGPIANPGMAAILAALSPESTNFLFYALHIDGDRHHFTRNYAEHNAFLNTPEFAHFGVFG